MDRVYIISQIIGLVAFIITLVAYHQKHKKNIFQTMMAANILDIIHSFLLGAYSGCITKILALIRNEIIIIKEKHKKLNNSFVLIVILSIYLVSGIITYENLKSKQNIPFL